MKATLVFDLPEESWLFNCAHNGTSWRGVVEDLDNYLRDKIKHSHRPAVYLDIIQELRNELQQLINSKHLDLHSEE